VLDHTLPATPTAIEVFEPRKKVKIKPWEYYRRKKNCDNCEHAQEPHTEDKVSIVDGKERLRVDVVVEDVAHREGGHIAAAREFLDPQHASQKPLEYFFEKAATKKNRRDQQDGFEQPYDVCQHGPEDVDTPDLEIFFFFLSIPFIGRRPRGRGFF